ncbi:MAG: MarR family transcriptional regulator [Verrucomicrobia bacterium]|nr:MarR family transcriptional regulator [Verrucomicrobiota bacterium]
MPTHHQGPEHEILALDAYIKLMRATESVTSRVHETLPTDLTVTQFAVLETLFHLGPLCQGQLATKLLKSTGNLTLVVANLEKVGLIKRERQPHDLRFITISLSPRGRSFIAKLFPKIAARIADEFSVLTSSEKIELCRLAKKLGLRATVK